MSNGHHALDEAFPGRFILGLGVGHQPWVEGMLGQRYDRPYSTMCRYLDALEQAPYFGPAATAPPVRVLAALGPRMLGLAAERTAGAHPYLVPLEHTAVARRHLGPDRLLCVEQAVVLETDRETARAVARAHLSTYLGLANYTSNLRRFGFGDDDLSGAGSDRLVDAIVTWGDVDDVARRVTAQFEAGASHVCVQVLTGGTEPPLPAWRQLAPALCGPPSHP
jgi:probable F420-dependent oxidoreductase